MLILYPIYSWCLFEYLEGLIHLEHSQFYEYSMERIVKHNPNLTMAMIHCHCKDKACLNHLFVNMNKWRKKTIRLWRLSLFKKKKISPINHHKLCTGNQVWMSNGDLICSQSHCVPVRDTCMLQVFQPFPGSFSCILLCISSCMYKQYPQFVSSKSNKAVISANLHVHESVQLSMKPHEEKASKYKKNIQTQRER